MYIYNVTIKVSLAIAADWEVWMKEKHIPDVLKTGCFVKHQFVKLLDHRDEEGETYAVQYYAETFQQYENYIQQYASALRNDGFALWGDKFVAFRTVMQIIQ